jgi:hypothetical protein
MIVFESRASTILYNLLRASPEQGVWLIPANVCSIVPLTFFKAGRAFELVDIERDSFCIDQAEVLARLQREPGRYSGLLFVRTYGLARSFENFLAQVRESAAELVVIDDRCLCLPSFDETESTVVDVTLFSTGYAKPVDLGFGGHAILRDGLICVPNLLEFERKQLEALNASCKQAIAARRRFEYVDSNWLDTRTPRVPLSAYREQVEEETQHALEHRRRLNRIYRDGLPPSILLGEEFDSWRLQIRVPQRDRLLADLFDNGLFAGAHYASLAGVFDDGIAPIAEGLHGEIVNLFNDRYYNERQARRTVELVGEHLKRVPSTG